MKRNKIIGLLIIILVGFVSCNDDSDNSTKLINQPILKWGASIDEINSRMKSFNLIESDAQNLYFAGQGLEHAISYYFVDGKLETALVTVCAENITQKALENLLNSYTYLGEQNNLSIYRQESAKTLAVISMKQVENVDYYYIGFSRTD